MTKKGHQKFSGVKSIFLKKVIWKFVFRPPSSVPSLGPCLRN